VKNSIEKIIIGKSCNNIDIEMFHLSKGPKTILLISGVHGDEAEAIDVLDFFIKEEIYEQFEGVCSIFAIPKLNPDGCFLKTRQNLNGVDLNRNMPTKDWDPKAHKEKYNPGKVSGSEPETKALINVIETLNPFCIISFHTYKPMVNYNGPSKGLAKVISEEIGYISVSDIGYPTPGSLGTWAGHERSMPTITFEIERGIGGKKAWERVRKSIISGITFVCKNEDLS
jgi:protein MpaA